MPESNVTRIIQEACTHFEGTLDELSNWLEDSESDDYELEQQRLNRRWGSLTELRELNQKFINGVEGAEQYVAYAQEAHAQAPSPGLDVAPAIPGEPQPGPRAGAVLAPDEGTVPGNWAGWQLNVEPEPTNAERLDAQSGLTAHLSTQIPTRPLRTSVHNRVRMTAGQWLSQPQDLRRQFSELNGQVEFVNPNSSVAPSDEDVFIALHAQITRMTVPFTERQDATNFGNWEERDAETS